MSWNYRLFKQDTLRAAEAEHLYYVAECYYDKDGKPELHSTMEHNLVSGNTGEEAKEAYQAMAEAFMQPPIELDAEGNFK